QDHAQLLRGEIWLQDKDYGRALAELNQIRDQGKLRVEAAALTGRCQLELKVPHQAERAYLFVLEHQPDHLDAHRGLAALYYDQGAFMRAVKHCEDWARLSPKEGRPHRFMGVIYSQLEL